jgi:hypothetical protein
MIDSPIGESIGPFHPEVIWPRNAKPLLLRSQWFLVFRHSYKNKFSTSSEKQKPDDYTSGFAFSCGADGTRTRDPRRDRPLF